MTPEQELTLANRAMEVLENEAYIKAFADIRAELMEKWENSPARDRSGRQAIWTMLAMLKKVQLALEATMDGGKVAKKELEYRHTVADRVRDFVGIEAD